MSHFYTVVLVPKEQGLTPDDPTNRLAWTPEMEKFVTAAVATQMHRYCEEREVEEYDRKCHCIDWDAQMAARKQANELHPLDDARTVLKERTAKELPEVQAVIDKDGGAFDLPGELSDQHDALWKEVLKPNKEAEAAFLKAHPMHDKPDPECEDCDGTGMYRSTENPESKWDWYRPGGRWARAIQKKEWKSPDNGFNFSRNGDALHLNTVTVEGMLAAWEDSDAPLALVTPDGEWHARTTMGWWGMEHGSQDRKTWQEGAKALLEKNPDCIAIGIDCHT